MNTEVSAIDHEIIQNLVLKGDIANLTPTQRVKYYTSMCQNLGIDPLTQPFSIIKLQGKETLYANKNCTQQLSKVYGIGLEVLRTERIEDVYVVTVRATNGSRFTDEIGAVTIGTLKGDGLANALMKASTKAKRRAVLAFCGLGMLDETELETVKGVTPLPLDIKLEPQELPDEQIITEEQLKALIITIEKNGFSVKELKEMALFNWNIDIDKLQNKHLLKIKAWFKEQKEKSNGEKKG